MKTYKYIVTGKVQGVWFRKNTKQIATQLGMTGYANNLVTGQVKVMATGTDEQHKELKAFLHVGSENAEVQTVDIEEMPQTSFEDFTTG
jgi:acylphosphatase